MDMSPELQTARKSTIGTPPRTKPVNTHTSNDPNCSGCGLGGRDPCEHASKDDSCNGCHPQLYPGSSFTLPTFSLLHLLLST